MMKLKTDLAKEACVDIKDSLGIKSENFISHGIEGNRVHVITEEAAEQIGKRKGEYVSFETEDVLLRNVEAYENISLALAEEIKKMLPEKDGSILIVGLGNENMTADSVGPETVKKIFVTGHIFRFMPEAADERMRSVCAISPGVLGVTGIESADIVKGICENENITAIIAVDALAARRTERMFSTFQISNAGIEPGAGVGNGRSALNRVSLGIPVIAVGVPTVIYASSLAFDAAAEILTSETGDISDKIEKIIKCKIGDMIVTPKEIDTVAADSAKIIADGINLALHSGMSLSEISAYMA